jgi:hypothetical protein
MASKNAANPNSLNRSAAGLQPTAAFLSANRFIGGASEGFYQGFMRRREAGGESSRQPRLFCCGSLNILCKSG